MVLIIVKWCIKGIYYGVIIISEGVFYIFVEDEIFVAGICFIYDVYGYFELGNISKVSFFNVLF